MDCPDVEDLKLQTHADGVRSEWEAYVADCRISNDGKHTKHGLCCDDHGSPLDFPSIVEAFWWATVTMTTVGFGEVYPRTEMGRVIATATMLSGILLIALPVAIIGRKFQEVYEDHQREEQEELVGDEADIAAASKALRSANAAKEPLSPNAVQDGPTLSEMSR